MRGHARRGRHVRGQLSVVLIHDPQHWGTLTLCPGADLGSIRFMLCDLEAVQRVVGGQPNFQERGVIQDDDTDNTDTDRYQNTANKMLLPGQFCFMILSQSYGPRYWKIKLLSLHRRIA
jgi:hypothetical protein